MANQLGRQMIILVWLCCFHLAAYGAPLSDESAAATMDSMSPDMTRAIGTTRARRFSRKASRKTSPTRSLVRYRYPIYTKRSDMDWNVNDDDQNNVDELNRDDIAENLSQQAKEIVLDILEEQNEKIRSRMGSNLKKTKKAFHFLQEKESTADENQDSSEMDEENDGDIDESFLNEIDALLSQLELEKGSRNEERAFDVKKRSEWKNLPRSAVRLSYMNAGESNLPQNQPANLHHSSSSSSSFITEKNNKKEQPKFLGHEFHRGGVPAPALTKSIAYPWKAMTMVNRSKKSPMATYPEDDDSNTRKKRSADDLPPVPVDEHDERNDSTLPLPTANDDSDIAKEVSDYFGYDKRSASDDASVRDFFQNYVDQEYYKSAAGSQADLRRKRAGQVKSGNKTSAWAKKRRSINVKNDFDSALRDAEEMLDATLLATQETQDLEKIDRMFNRLVASLISELNEEELNQATSKIVQELIQGENDSDLQDRLRDAAVNTDNHRYDMPVKNLLIGERFAAHRKNLRDDRRKRFSPKQLHHRQSTLKDEGECAVAEQVMANCDSVVHLMGGYRPILMDACYRQQACSICSVAGEESERCNVEFQQYASAICGADLLCRSQSRQLLSVLFQIDRMKGELFQDNRDQIQALCHRESCLAEFWKRR